MAWIFTSKSRDVPVQPADDHQRPQRRTGDTSPLSREECEIACSATDSRQRQYHGAGMEDVDMRDAYVSLTKDDTHSISDFDKVSRPSRESDPINTGQAVGEQRSQQVSHDAPKAMSDSPGKPRKRKSQGADVSDAQEPASPVQSRSSISSRAGLIPRDSSFTVNLHLYKPTSNFINSDGDLIKSLTTKPMTIPQLVHEIKAVYAGLGT